ncbi:MAG: phospholipid carrier-dependent glycosyltransferase [Faecalibacterium sp.]|nr:phospholipid carrier-dependent glycosyltransferase [Faecalibacterium sp.]
MLTAESEKKRWKRTVLLCAAGAFMLQLALAAATEKYPYDFGCFAGWAMRMAELGPGGFYADGYFCDYPPGYMLLLWLPGKLIRLPGCPEVLQKVLLAFWPALAGAAIALVIWRIGCRRQTPAAAARVAIFAAFCPAILYDTGVWGQIDSVFSLLILCCFALLEEKRPIPAALFYGLALAVKPQALLVGPALAICFLWPAVFAASRPKVIRALRDAALGALAAVAPVVVCGLPFWGLLGLANGLLEKYGTTATSYPYATINACNFFAFLGGEWQSQTQEALHLGGLTLLTWQQLGVLLIVAVTAFAAVWAWKSQRAGRFSPLLLAAVYGVGIFTLAHRMHERYLVFAVVLLLAAAARFGDKKLLSLAAGFSLTSLLNMALVFGVVGTDNEYLNDNVSILMQRGVGLAETVLFILLAVWAWRRTVQGRAAPLADALPQSAVQPPEAKQPHAGPKAGAHPAKAVQAAQKNTACGSAKKTPQGAPSLAAPAPQPVWTKPERIFLLALTAATALLSFSYLGDFTAPQTCLDANGTTATFTLTPAGTAAQLQLYTGISSDNAGHISVMSADGTAVAEQDLNWGTCFGWYSYALDGSAFYTVTLSDGQLFEAAFRDHDGNLLGLATGETAVADEQAAVPDAVSQLNTFYFDEIYHARTGYELLHGMTVYETTHPPLGKDFIALGIALFGMTGFGWRFFGTLFGVLLVPLLYCFVRRLTRKPSLGAFAGILLGLDFMRFSQSRIATIDTYAVFFILLAVDGMVWYGQRVLVSGVRKAVLPMAASGVAFGLACAAKWTGLYAGAGLAVLYFGILVLRRRQLYAGDAAAGKKAFWPEFGMAILGGCVFFVAVPLCIYLASYAPYWFRDHTFSLAEWWGCQKYMYWYHSTLEATHPFSSNWYSWLFDLRPVWYYMGGGLPAGKYASIAGFISPAVALVGLAAWLRTAQRQLVGEGSRASGVVIVALLSSLLPWVMVTRCTFLYHYFPCVPFLIAAAALELGHLAEKSPRRAKKAGMAVLAAAAVLFLWFYPVLSGLPVGRIWAASMQWLPSWGFYILG